MSDDSNLYYHKYLFYKKKYLTLKKLIGGNPPSYIVSEYEKANIVELEKNPFYYHIKNLQRNLIQSNGLDDALYSGINYLTFGDADASNLEYFNSCYSFFPSFFVVISLPFCLIFPAIFFVAFLVSFTRGMIWNEQFFTY